MVSQNNSIGPAKVYKVKYEFKELCKRLQT